MYICICHAITDSHVGRALSQGCGSVGEVFRHMGERPNCGKCVPELCRKVRAMRAASAVNPALAGAGD